MVAENSQVVADRTKRSRPSASKVRRIGFFADKPHYVNLVPAVSEIASVMAQAWQ